MSNSMTETMGFVGERYDQSIHYMPGFGSVYLSMILAVPIDVTLAKTVARPRFRTEIARGIDAVICHFSPA